MFEKDSEHEEDWKLQLKEIVAKMMNLLSNECIRTVMHVEERDLIDKGILEALNAIAAHNDIFQLFSREELDAMLTNARQQ